MHLSVVQERNRIGVKNWSRTVHVKSKKCYVFYLRKYLHLQTIPRLACFINIWVSPELDLDRKCCLTLQSMIIHIYIYACTHTCTHTKSLYLKGAFSDLLTAVGIVLYNWQMVHLFEVIKWMDKQKTEKKPLNIHIWSCAYRWRHCAFWMTW